MATTASNLEAYNEAKDICAKYQTYTGDKRRASYKRLSESVSGYYRARMNNFGKKLGLPTYEETFYNI